MGNPMLNIIQIHEASRGAAESDEQAETRECKIHGLPKKKKSEPEMFHLLHCTCIVFISLN